MLKARDARGSTALQEAAWGTTPGASLLVLNARKAKESTPHHSAVLNSSCRAISALVVDGADMNARNAAGQTVLDIARKRMHGVCIDTLVAAEAEDNDTN